MEISTNYFMINTEEQEPVFSDWERIRAVVASVREEAAKVIVGQEDVVDQMLVSLLCRGHCLIVGVPGLAKTLLVGTLGRILGLDFKRIQFTPDLMPPDILGSEILQTAANGSRAFEYVPGPVFTNLLLADEINRTPPKTQAALLEAMQEKQVTVAGKTRTLAEPFVVYATQNPLEHEGTYPLPEAQLDRFLMRISMVSPTKEQERAILQRFMKEEPLETLQSVCTREDILALQKQAKEIYIHPVLLDYMIDLVQATRSWPNIDMGVSPRGSLALVRAVRAYALVRGGAYVVPEDIKTVAVPVLAHRLQLSGSVGSTDAQKKAMTDVLSSVALPTEDWSK